MSQLTAFTCPECNGALSRLKEGNIIRFRCHTGHAFTIKALLSEVSDACVQLFGGYGYTTEYRISEIWADARVNRIYAGTNEIMKELVGRSMGL